MRIAVDANGADLGPAEVAAGAAIAASRGVTPVLFGPAEQIGAVAEGIEVVDAPVSIAAVRQTQDSSIVPAARAIADGDYEALVTCATSASPMTGGLADIPR